MGYHPLYQEIFHGKPYKKAEGKISAEIPFTDSLEQLSLKFGGKIGNFLENLDKDDPGQATWNDDECKVRFRTVEFQFGRIITDFVDLKETQDMIDDFRYGQIGVAEKKRKQMLEKLHEREESEEEDGPSHEGFFSRMFGKRKISSRLIDQESVDEREQQQQQKKGIFLVKIAVTNH